MTTERKPIFMVGAPKGTTMADLEGNRKYLKDQLPNYIAMVYLQNDNTEWKFELFSEKTSIKDKMKIAAAIKELQSKEPQGL